MPNVWTEDDTEKLIALYGQYQCLWNPFHLEFNNKLSRYKAYQEIKNSIHIPGLTICDCIERITNVKKEYCYELSKITAAIFCEKLYAPKAKWFKRMHVLLFPYMSHYNNFEKQDSNEQKFNDGSTQDNLLHLSFEKSEGKHICSNETCGTCELQEIELCLKLRDTIYSAPKLQDTITSETIQTVDVAAETSNNVIVEHETQTDMPHEQKYGVDVNKGKKDCSTYMDNIFEIHGIKEIEDNFDRFGKSVAFQLRTIDIQTTVELKKEIQNLITRTRLKILKSKLIDQSSSSICCCDCSDCKVICKDETCSCGLTLRECLLLTKMGENQDYSLCYK